MTPEPVVTFESQRARLRGIAYRMLGTPDDADDIVQETWIRFAAADPAGIENTDAWLTTVTTRLAIDRLRSAQHRREAYVGPWLADPVDEASTVEVGPDHRLLLAESLSLGFLAVLERLSPLERAVFLLHEVFAYPLGDVASIVERSPAATRQLAVRARQHVQDGRPRFDPDPADVHSLTQLVLAAAMDGDVETLASYLADDVVHISDGGAHHRAARLPVRGVDRVARFLVGIAQKAEPEMEYHEVQANGQLALYSTQAGQPYMLHVANWVDGKLAGSFAVRNPEKLAAFHRAWLAKTGAI